MAEKQKNAGREGRWQRRAYWVLGMLMLALAVVGAVLPVMPTTIFVILAAACFGRASPRWEAYLLHHPRFGPPLAAWPEQGALSAPGTPPAVSGLPLGLWVFWCPLPHHLWLGLL